MIEKYKKYLLVNGKSALTILNHTNKIKKFLKIVKIKNINEKNIEKFLLDIIENNKPSTANNYRASISSFLKFLKKDIAIPKSLKLEKKLPDSINEEFLKKEVVPVIECIYQNPLKIKTIIYFMFYTGVRREELVKLKREHIDLTSREVKVYGKGKEERIVFIPKEIKRLLESYFASENEKINAFNINYEALGQVFKKAKPYFKKINFRPHLLRHGYATMLSNKGVNGTTLQRLMGHKDIRTTQRYIGAETKELKKIYDRAMEEKK